MQVISMKFLRGLLMVGLSSSLTSCVSEYDFDKNPNTIGQQDTVVKEPPASSGSASGTATGTGSGTGMATGSTTGTATGSGSGSGSGSGTGTPDPKPSTKPSPAPTVLVTDTSTVPQIDQTKVDMVFIVDNSGSMADEQVIVAQNFEAFIREFAQKDIDFRIAVLSTDVTDPSGNTYWSSNNYASYWQASRGNLMTRYADEKWLTKNSSDLATKFKQNVLLGTRGSGREQGLNSLMYALGEDKLMSGGFNESFLRPDSLLSVIVVSDEDEDIFNQDGNNPAERISRVASRLAELRGPKSKGFRFDFVVDLDASNPGNVTYPLATNRTNSYPNVYLKAAEKFKSKTYNIRGSFGDDLVEIGADIAAQAEAFHRLSKPPVVATIVVTLGGEVVPQNSLNGYVYHEDRNSIELTGSYLRNSPGKTISIRYTAR